MNANERESEKEISVNLRALAVETRGNRLGVNYDETTEGTEGFAEDTE